MSVNRHLSRTIAMQSLYEWDFHPDSDAIVIADRVMEPVKKDVDVDYVHRVVKGAVDNHKEIDELVTKAAPEWPLDQISVIDKSILRLSGFELLKDQDIPPKVAINEAVEIAKTFGGENSSKFINGVLGTLYRNSDRFVVEAPKAEDNEQAKPAESAEVIEEKPAEEPKAEETKADEPAA